MGCIFKEMFSNRHLTTNVAVYLYGSMLSLLRLVRYQKLEPSSNVGYDQFVRIVWSHFGQQA
jgi:hypothetical protein